MATTERELCGDCRHGAHNSGPCQTVTVNGPPSTTVPTRDDPHPGRTTTPCTCQQSTPYRNGVSVT